MSLIIKGKEVKTEIIQGGMGVGVSLAPLASAVAKEGGVGVISSACLDRIVGKRIKRKIGIYEAISIEIANAKNMSNNGLIGINIMFALQKDFEDSVRGAIDAGADFIISGAGLPLNLPAIQSPKDTALIPIISSARALKIICKRWEKLGYLPDAIVLEGPLAGGHLGFKMDQIELEPNTLENLLPEVKDTAMKYGDFPVIVAGGIYTNEDIARFLKMGADGVQMGTRFLATKESSASEQYKQAVIKAKNDDIIVVDPKVNPPGSSCGLPFRIIKQSPMFISAQKKMRAPKCDKGYVLLKDENGKFSRCPAKKSNENCFCICNGLLSSAGYNSEEEEPLYTVGTNAFRVNKIISVKILMDELKGKS
ncbi:nitronate monooxygenase [Patescibacteria group bacterium]|nr:nitronate monooxygenase [Patescibacteria group bacterium]